MLDIDTIFTMISNYDDEEMQKRGIEEGKRVKALSVFILPMEGKVLWENCAKILISKSDKELECYFMSLFDWFQDLNWPGAYLIYDRLKTVPEKELLPSFKIALLMAKKRHDTIWEQALMEFKVDSALKDSEVD